MKYYKCPMCHKQNSENFVDDKGRIECKFCSFIYYAHNLNFHDDEFETVRDKIIRGMGNK